MSEKVSILTLRLTAEEAAQMEVLKSITGKKSGSEAIKYIVKEYPRFCAHYKQEAREKGELQRKYQDQKIAVGDFLEKLKNRKSDFIVQAVWEYIRNHPEVMAENAKIVITIQSTPTDEQTIARIQSMIDASVERLKERIKLQIEQEQQNGQEVFDGPNEQDLDNMLDNLLIFDQ